MKRYEKHVDICWPCCTNHWVVHLFALFTVTAGVVAASRCAALLLLWPWICWRPWFATDVCWQCGGTQPWQTPEPIGTRWDWCSCKHCKLQFVLNSKISKGPILPRSNRGKAASQFFMSLNVFARRFRETATIISQGTATVEGFDTKENIWVQICCLSSASHNLHTCSNLAEA